MSPNKSKVVIYGTGGHAKVVLDMAEKSGVVEIVAFLDDREQQEFQGYPVLGGNPALGSLKDRGVEGVVIAIGEARTRKRLTEQALALGLTLQTIVHPSAQVARGAVLGAGTVVMPGAVVGPDCRMGLSCIVNTGAGIDHDCRLGDYVQIAPGAHLGGGATIGDGTFIGIGASIREMTTVGAWSLVGMGAAVVNDMPSNQLVYGVPARIIRPLDGPDHSSGKDQP